MKTENSNNLEVIYEDNHILAINKQPGMIVQVDKSGDKSMDEMVQEYLAEKYHKPGKAFVGVIHRLDRPVSGVILFARTSKALDRMNMQFKEREVNKTYWAVTRVEPKIHEDTLVHWLLKDRDSNVVKHYDHEVPGSQRAELSYKLKGAENGFFLLEVNPITGRSHQIRVQISSLGCPICGDNKYGYPRGYKEKFIGLHARRLRFMHPVKKEPVEIIAPLPGLEFWDIWRNVPA